MSVLNKVEGYDDAYSTLVNRQCKEFNLEHCAHRSKHSMKQLAVLDRMLPNTSTTFQKNLWTPSFLISSFTGFGILRL